MTNKRDKIRNINVRKCIIYALSRKARAADLADGVSPSMESPVSPILKRLKR